jgi:hypothetical protein
VADGFDVAARRDCRIATEVAMPNESTPLALVAVTPPLRRDVVATRLPQRALPSAGPGWFESSWELRRGLEVKEGWSEDDRVRDWIEDFLAAQRTVARTVSPSARTAIA